MPFDGEGMDPILLMISSGCARRRASDVRAASRRRRREGRRRDSNRAQRWSIGKTAVAATTITDERGSSSETDRC